MRRNQPFVLLKHPLERSFIPLNQILQLLILIKFLSHYCEITFNTSLHNLCLLFLLPLLLSLSDVKLFHLLNKLLFTDYLKSFSHLSLNSRNIGWNRHLCDFGCKPSLRYFARSVGNLSYWSFHLINNQFTLRQLLHSYSQVIRQSYSSPSCQSPYIGANSSTWASSVYGCKVAHTQWNHSTFALPWRWCWTRYFGSSRIQGFPVRNSAQSIWGSCMYEFSVLLSSS